MFKINKFLLFAIVFNASLSAQSVKILFRYQPQGQYARVHFPGSFNGWGPNSSGAIASGTVSQADSVEQSTGLYIKTFDIPFGSHQYKIYRQLTETASNWIWIPDPLNRIVIQPDQNSSLTVDSIVLFQLCPVPYEIESNKFVSKSSTPLLSAGIFQPAGSPVPVISLLLDGKQIPSPNQYYQSSTGILSYKPLIAIPDGSHSFVVSVKAGSQVKIDSVLFETRSRNVQIESPSFTTRKTQYIVSGFVLKADGSGLDSTLTSASLWNNFDSKTIPLFNGRFIDTTSLKEGKNLIKIVTPNGADSVTVIRIVNHTPFARAYALQSGASIILTASATTDPDSQLVKIFLWRDDLATPLGLNGKTGEQLTIQKPVKPGEYYFGLVAVDPDGNADTMRSYFIINADGSVGNPTIASNPQWAKQARVYFLFPRDVKVNGTINDAAERLPFIRQMGFNVVWMMPVMKNAYPINIGYGPGYNITDFYHVAPEYGTDADFKRFVDQAHALGLKVILDVTPNHTSRFHPWSEDAHAKKQNSPYWNWYEHTIIPHNDNGLGQSKDGDGFNYYSGFSDQLLNVNWRDVDFQFEMINVYKYWIREFGLDGYRFDVYWGPHRRYGEKFMGKPVRDALKHIKPDILLLAEDDGTGGGTETIYADYSSAGINGGVDAAYDFKLYFNQIRNFSFGTTAVENLHTEILNAGYYPGPNSLYMRFMESQDEDRISYFYSSSGLFDANATFRRTMPMASVIFSVPGFPMIWNGQEVGWGYGISGAKEARNRSVINWDYQGKSVLTPHYTRLATIRGLFPAFSSQKFIRLSTGNQIVYSFSRPWNNQNLITAVNFSDLQSTAALVLNATGSAPNVEFGTAPVDGKKYYLSDVYNDSVYQIAFTGGAASYPIVLPPYGTAIFVLSDSLCKYPTSVLDTDPRRMLPLTLSLHQNYPNPFNPQTTIGYAVPSKQFVELSIYDLLGRKVAVLASEIKDAGHHQVQWNAAGLPSGMYFSRLESGGTVFTNRMLLLK